MKCFVFLLTALRGETCRSMSLPDNKLVSNSQQQQPVTASSSLIASVEDKCLRPVDGSTPLRTVDRTPAMADVKSPTCDVVVMSHDVPSPIRNIRPTLLDMAAVPSSKVDSSPDDRKPLVGILLNRSPRRNSLLRFVVMFILLCVTDVLYFFSMCIKILCSVCCKMLYSLDKVCLNALELKIILPLNCLHSFHSPDSNLQVHSTRL